METEDIKLPEMSGNKEGSFWKGLLIGLAAIGGTLLLAELFKSLSTPKKVYRCPNCNGAIDYKTNPCPHCHINLEWDF